MFLKAYKVVLTSTRVKSHSGSYIPWKKFKKLWTPFDLKIKFFPRLAGTNNIQGLYTLQLQLCCSTGDIAHSSSWKMSTISSTWLSQPSNQPVRSYFAREEKTHFLFPTHTCVNVKPCDSQSLLNYNSKMDRPYGGEGGGDNTSLCRELLSG